MGLDVDYADGQTPLDEDKKEGLLIPTIATRVELDGFPVICTGSNKKSLFNTKLVFKKIGNNSMPIFLTGG